jgi:hypothetical protein
MIEDGGTPAGLKSVCQSVSALCTHSMSPSLKNDSQMNSELMNESEKARFDFLKREDLSLTAEQVELVLNDKSIKVRGALVARKDVFLTPLQIERGWWIVWEMEAKPE